MKLLFFSDVHNNVAAARRLADLALRSHADGLLSGGDLALHEEHDRDMYAAFVSTRLPVWSVPGNHDGDDRYREVVDRYGWTDIDGRVVLLGATWLAGWGIRYSYKPYYNPDPHRQEHDPVLGFVAGELKSKPGRRALISHVPPFGTGASIEKGGSRGNVQLRGIIDEVGAAFALSGHVHHSKVVEEQLPGGCSVVNAGPHGYLVDLA